MSKKILYIGGFELPDKNAAAQRVMANAKLLREMGFDVSFIGITKDFKNAPSDVDGFESIPVPYPTSTKQWIHQIATFVDTKIILERKPDYVILYNFPSIASLKILKACHKHGIKVIHDLTEWEIADGWNIRSIIRKLDINLRMRYCMKKMDGIICISRYLFDYYSRYTKCILMPPTVDLQDCKWNRDRELSTGDNIKLIYAGTAGFGTKDRLDHIIDAMDGNRDLHLTVIGMTLEQFEQGYGRKVPETVSVDFRGRVPHTEAVRAVCEADFQMLIRDDTLKTRAGFPTKLVESMSCCTPLISTVTSNITDYLHDGENSILVTDQRTLEKVMEELYSMPAERIIAMKETCRAFEGFDYRQYKNEFSRIFD